MKKKLVGSVILLLFTVNFYGAPLIFKATKIIENQNEIELFNLDTSKLSQLKLVILFEGELSEDPSKKVFRDIAKQKLERAKKLYETGDVSKTEVDKAQQEYDELENNKLFSSMDLNVLAIENEDLIFLCSGSGSRFEKIIELPPTKLSVSVKGKGKYRIFVWGK